MLTYTKTLTTADYFKNFNCADYTDCVIQLNGIWAGTIEFYATNKGEPTGVSEMDLFAVQSITGTSWTTAVTSESGSSPSTERNIFRVPVAGLTNIAIYGDVLINPMFGTPFSGSVELTVTFVSNTNAR